ncbi:MAG TPA: hypothetical protein ENK26_11395 [Gammaproteobacteria bacterium]|nr:hypothetical protein [Gammaproteobacteria bacterium]
MRCAAGFLLLLWLAPAWAGIDEARSNLTRDYPAAARRLAGQPDFRWVDHRLLATQGFRRESGVPRAARRRCPCEGDVIISRVGLSLEDDFDHDGFFQFVRLDFSLRSRLPRADVFARVFVSFEGGPWNLFATTRKLALTNDAPLAYAIESRLRTGYPSGYYDVLIEVFDDFSGQWLLSYGPYEDRALRAAPLESANRDEFSGSVSGLGYAVYGTGGLSAWGLLGLALLIRLRSGRGRWRIAAGLGRTS